MPARGYQPGPDEHDEDDGERQCLMGEWCNDPRIIRDGGNLTRLPALTSRVFCDVDRSYFAARLGEMDSAYDRLAAELAEQARRGRPVRSPFGPRLPLREDVDAQMRLVASTLCTWEARVRAIPATGLRLRGTGSIHDSDTVKQAVATLGEWVDALLALGPAWMTRRLPMNPGRPGRPSPVISDDIADVYGECEIVRMGASELTVLVRASGRDAGNEILRLHYLARRVLGETKAAPESFEGVPCRSCEAMALERAEPPSDPSRPAMHSRCAACDHAMDRKTFDEWAKWYAGWADRAGLSCRRCRRGDHEACVYDRCACAAGGHLALMTVAGF